MSRPAVVVIGAGIVGAATAEALARAGRRAHLLERATVASGATGFSGGLVRCYEGDEPRSALAAEGARALRELDRRTGGGCGYVEAGSVYLEPPGREDAAGGLAACLAADGWPVLVLDPAEGAARFPQLRWDGVGVAVQEPRAGYADPVRTVRTLLDLARAGGTVVHEHCRARAVVERSGRVTGVDVGDRVLPADAVVVAGGPWSPELLDPLGVGGELRTKRIQYVLAAYRGDRPLPTVIDAIDDLYCRPDGRGRALLGAGLEDWDTAPGELAPEAEASTRIVEALRWRVPGVIGQAQVTAIAASDLYAPGGLGHLGFFGALDGLYVATGWSGAGFKMGLGIGRQVAGDLVRWLDG